MMKILTNIIILFMRKEGREMMAKLWAIEIMKQETTEEAKAAYQRVPRLLKEQVKQILTDAGFEDITS